MRQQVRNCVGQENEHDAPLPHTHKRASSHHVTLICSGSNKIETESKARRFTRLASLPSVAFSTSDHCSVCQFTSILQICDHKSGRVCSHSSRNEFLPCKEGSCSITQLFPGPKVSKSHCVLLQEPFVCNVRTLSIN